MRSPSKMAVIDMESEKVALMLGGDWKYQHEAEILEGGDIVFFDNEGLPGNSRIREIAPPDWEVKWEYAGSPPRSFYSALHGAIQTLRGGNLLITESNAGRAFEITREKEIVWEYFSPHRPSDDPELVAVLFDMNRIDPRFPMEWLRNGRNGVRH